MCPAEVIERGGGRSLAQQLVDRLTDRIRNGDYRPGERLPTEGAMVQTYGVSRTVVREAISRLQAAGIVETQRGRGSFVLTRPRTTSFGIDTDELQAVQDVVELVEFRIAIEVEAAGLAAVRRTETDLARIRTALDAFSEAARRPSDAIKADFAFHHAISTATGNRYLGDLLGALGTAMIVMPRTRLAATSTAEEQRRLDRVGTEHEAIYSAIASQDAEMARAAIRMHLGSSRDRLGARP